MTTVRLLIEGQWYGCHDASAPVRETAERRVETGSTPRSTPWLTRLHPRPGDTGSRRTDLPHGCRASRGVQGKSAHHSRRQSPGNLEEGNHA
jgi:hypothetical protein